MEMIIFSLLNWRQLNERDYSDRIRAHGNGQKNNTDGIRIRTEYE